MVIIRNFEVVRSQDRSPKGGTVFEETESPKSFRGTGTVENTLDQGIRRTLFPLFGLGNVPGPFPHFTAGNGWNLQWGPAP